MSFAKPRTLLPLLLSLTSCNSATHSPTSDSPYGGTSASGSATGGASAAGKGGTSVPGLGGLSSGGNSTAAGGTSGIVGSAGSVAATGGAGVTTTQGGTIAVGSAGTTATFATGGTPISNGGSLTQGGAAVASAGASGGVTGGSTGVVIGTAGAAGSTGTNACGIAIVPSGLTPLYMVFIYDKSGSMGDSPSASWQNSATRWAPMKAGMIDFFAHNATIGIQASLEFFPAPGDLATTCHADYKTPAVPITPLETPSPLISALESATPGGGTPTLPAVMGGLAYAKQLMANDPGSKAVVVLVTDGEPAVYDPTTGTIETNCAPANNPAGLTNTIADIVSVVSAANHAASTPVSTYVIGIGEAQGDLAAIASAGGTQYVQLDATQPPETTRTRLTQALDGIRTSQFQCSLQLPTSISFQKDGLNVSFKHGNGTVDDLVQAPSCATPGWYYDNAAAPTKVMFCPLTCSAIQSDATGSFQLEFGCPTRTN